jgi:hypothetical protein
VLEMSSDLPKGRPISIYKHPKQIELLGAKKVVDARDRRAVQCLLLLANATDASVALATDVASASDGLAVRHMYSTV